MHIIIRLSGEMIIKSPYVRRQFQQRLIANIRAACAEVPGKVRIIEEWGILHLYSEGPEPRGILPRIFGIKSLTPIEGSCPSTLADIVATGTTLYKDRLVGKSFAVRAQRHGKHDFSSMDAQTSLGAALNAEQRSQVDLRSPEFVVNVQIRKETTYFYSESIPGPGGFPAGSGGRALCLLSGGFDSSAAAWLIQKRGIAVDYVFFNLAGSAYEHSVVKVAKFLADQWSMGTNPRLYVVDFTGISAHLRQQVKPRFLQVMLKRQFYRAACLIARKARAQALITGEAIGQVSSQTLQNLASIEAGTTHPVLRPLIAMDKDEIIALTQKIGTYDLTKSTQEFCQLTSERPATACHRWQLDEAEHSLDATLLEQAVAQAKEVQLPQVSLTRLLDECIFTNELAPNTYLIDCRTDEEFRSWHYPEAHHHEFYDLAANFKRLPLPATYILYCAVGVQSAILAEKMQVAGYMAYSFKGGVEALKTISQK